MDICHEIGNIENDYGAIELKELMLELLELIVVKLLEEFMLEFLKRVKELFKRDNIEPQQKGYDVVIASG